MTALSKQAWNQKDVIITIMLSTLHIFISSKKIILQMFLMCKTGKKACDATFFFYSECINSLFKNLFSMLRFAFIIAKQIFKQNMLINVPVWRICTDNMRWFWNQMFYDNNLKDNFNYKGFQDLTFCPHRLGWLE